MFVGRVIPNKKFENVIRAFHVLPHAAQSRARACCWSARYSGFERYLAMLHALIARLGTPDVHFLGHVSNEELTALYDVADLFLCASEHEGFCVPIIEAFYKQRPGAGLCRHRRAGDDGRRRRAVRHAGSIRGGPADGGRARRPPAGRRRWSTRRTPRWRGCWPGTSARLLLRNVERAARGRAPAAPRSRGTSGPSSISSNGSRSCGSSGPALFRALPEEPALGGSGLGARQRLASSPVRGREAIAFAGRGTNRRTPERPSARTPSAERP